MRAVLRFVIMKSLYCTYRNTLAYFFDCRVKLALPIARLAVILREDGLSDEVGVTVIFDSCTRHLGRLNYGR